MNREMGTVGSPMSRPGLNSLTGLSGVPISRFTNYSETPNSWIGTSPDIPAGRFKVQGVVSAHNRSAATVTQAGGVNGLPAFSSWGQKEAGGRGRQDSVKRLRKPASTVGPMNGERSSAPGGCGNGRLPSLRADLGRPPVSFCPRVSSFVQASAHPVTVDTPRNSEAGRGERCRLVSGLKPVGGTRKWGTWQ